MPAQLLEDMLLASACGCIDKYAQSLDIAARLWIYGLICLVGCLCTNMCVVAFVSAGALLGVLLVCWPPRGSLYLQLMATGYAVDALTSILDSRHTGEPLHVRAAVPPLWRLPLWAACGHMLGKKHRRQCCNMRLRTAASASTDCEVAP